MIIIFNWQILGYLLKQMFEYDVNTTSIFRS